MASASYAPSVLLVEDDLPAREYLTQRFYEETSLGVVVAKDLTEARELIDSADVQVDAIFADLYFDVGTDDPADDLRDGIDVLSYGVTKRPAILGYVNSYWADRQEYVEKAARLQLPIRDWFHKQPLMPGDASSPWAQVERDLIALRLTRESKINPALPSLTVVTEAIRRQLCPIRRTYIQDLADDSFRVLKPIEVLAWCGEDGVVHASAPKLGLLTDASGDSLPEALERLCQLIAEHKHDLDEKAESLAGYAAFVKGRLDMFVTSK